MARLAPEDPYGGLAPKDRLAQGPFADLDLYDPTEPSPESLEEIARVAEDAARAMPRITNSEGGSASNSSTHWRLVTSDGFSGVYRASGFSVGASVVAGDGEAMESGYDGRSTRYHADLPDA